MSQLAVLDSLFQEDYSPFSQSENFSLTQQATLSVSTEDHFQNHPDWLSFLESFQSKEIYKARIQDFFNYQATLIDQFDQLQRLKNYFVEEHNKKNLDQSPKHAATAYRQWFSIFKKFWLLTGRGDLESLCPLLWTSFDSWEKGYLESHAKEFTRKMLQQYHLTCPENDVDHEFYKSYSVVGTSYGGRSGEPIKVHFWQPGCKPDKDHSYISKRDDGSYMIQYNRNKQRKKTDQRKDTFTIITGELEISVLDRWISYFPPSPTINGNGQSGRFFRKLKKDKDGNLSSTLQLIGKTKCQQVATNIAKFLNLDDYKEYRGQSWRGTAATIGADTLTDSELQNLTGHASVNSLSVYKANSETQKQKVATAVSIFPKVVFTTPSVQSPVIGVKRIRSKQGKNITVNITNSGKITHLELLTNDDNDKNELVDSVDNSESDSD
jgi:hypothetical protein